MTRCACERDGNPIPSPVRQQQRGDKGGKLFIKVSLECCAGPGKRREAGHTQAPGDQGCSGAAPGKGNAGEAGQAPRTKPSKPSGTGEGDGGASAEEGTGKALRRYRENSNCHQPPRATEAKSTAMAWHLLAGMKQGSKSNYRALVGRA